MANLPTIPNYFPSYCPYDIFSLRSVKIITLEVNQLDFKKSRQFMGKYPRF